MPSSLANRERKTIDSIIPSTISSTIETSSTVRSTFVPIPQSSSSSTTALNSFKLQTKDQVAYVDDEDLETDLEASGSNRIRNDTSIAYQLDDSSTENEN